MAQPIGDPARDERELTQLVKDLNEAVVKADVAVLDRVLHEDYVHHRPRGMVEDRAQYLENRKARRVDFEFARAGRDQSARLRRYRHRDRSFHRQGKGPIREDG